MTEHHQSLDIVIDRPFKIFLMDEFNDYVANRVKKRKKPPNKANARGSYKVGPKCIE